MPHFVSPGQAAPGAARGRVPVRASSTASATPIRTDERLRAELDLPAFEDSLVRVDPGYGRPLRICRLDAFLIGDRVRFLEFNADSPAGIGYTDVLAEGLRRSDRAAERRGRLRHRLRADAAAADRHAARRLRASCAPPPARASRAPAPRAGRPPRAARRCPSSGSSAGAAARPGSRRCARDHRGARLRRLGAARRRRAVDLVYRRALVDDLAEGDLTAAYRDGRVCVVNPPRARVANNKKLFALLGDPRFARPRRARRRRR